MSGNFKWGLKDIAVFLEGGNMSTRTLNATFQEIARAMTDHTRVADSKNNIVQSDVYTSHTLVRVNFSWLVFPAEANTKSPQMIRKSC